jgi:hypothetical protein
MTGFLLLASFVGGYVGAIYSWPRLKIWVKGAQAEITSLRAKADALANTIKSQH